MNVEDKQCTDDMADLVFCQNTFYVLIKQITNDTVLLEEYKTEEQAMFKVLTTLEYENSKYEFLQKIGHNSYNKVLVCCSAITDERKFYGELFTNCKEFQPVTNLYEEKSRQKLSYGNIFETDEEKEIKSYEHKVRDLVSAKQKFFFLNPDDNRQNPPHIVTLTNWSDNDKKCTFRVIDELDYKSYHCEFLVSNDNQSTENILVCISATLQTDEYCAGGKYYSELLQDEEVFQEAVIIFESRIDEAFRKKITYINFTYEDCGVNEIERGC